MRVFFVLIFYTLTTLPLRAEILSATATGRTMNTGIEQEFLTQRATANAIENFLLHNGAEIKAITIVEDGEIAFDQIRVNSEHRLLGFDTLQYEATEEYTEVKLNIYYGKIGSAHQCRDRKNLEITLTGVTADVSPSAPAFLVSTKKYLHEGIEDLTKNMGFVNLEYKPSPATKTEFKLDYNVLASAQNTTERTTTKDTVSIKLEVMQDSPTGQVNMKFYTASSNNILERKMGTVATNAEIYALSAQLLLRKAPRPRTDVISDLLTPYLNKFSEVLKQISCEPISTALIKEGDQYRVEIGSRDGVTKSSVFLFENGPTSGFGVRKLFLNETQLVPLQSIFPVEPKDGASLYLVK